MSLFLLEGKNFQQLRIGYGNVPPPPSCYRREKLGEFKIFPGFSLEFIVNKIWLNKSSPSKAGCDITVATL
jgi:hypothetical protein